MAVGRPVYLENTRIPFKTSLKIIGVTLDRNLNFKAHFARVKRECESRRRLVKVISKRRNNNSRKSIIRISNCILTSKLLYGTELTCWGLKELIQTLGPVYNTAVRNASSLMPSTPAIAACAEIGVLPFDMLAMRWTINRLVDFLGKTSGDGGTLQNIANRIAEDLSGNILPAVSKVERVFLRRWDEKGPKIDWGIKRNVKAGDPPEKVVPIFRNHCEAHYENHRLIYTDGSKTEEGVGVGVALPDRGWFRRLPEMCTVFSAEAAGILKAVSFAISQPGPTVIFTDSASVLMALENGKSMHPWIQTIEEALSPKISLCWIPGHCGISGNIEADELARIGRKGIIQSRAVPGPDLRLWLKHETQRHFDNRWWNESNNFLRKIKSTTCSWADRSDRKEQTVLSRLRTGHTRITHILPSGIFRKPFCENCHTQQTIEHMITVCPVLQGFRETCGIPTSIRDVLSNDAVMETNTLLFLKEAGLYDRI